MIEEVKTVLDLLDPTLQIVLLTARPHRVHHLTEAWLRRYEIRWDLLIMRPWGDYELSRDFKQSTVWELRAPASSSRSPSRTTAATSRCSGRRAFPASTSTPATTTENRLCRRAEQGTKRARRCVVPGTMNKNSIKTAVLLARFGALFLGIGSLFGTGGLIIGLGPRPRVRRRVLLVLRHARGARPPAPSPSPKQEAPQLYAIVRDLTPARRHADAEDLHLPGRSSRTRSQPVATPNTPRSP